MLDRLLGNSMAMAKLRTFVIRVAATESRVLILGENGTGKELVAQAIHEASKRKEKLFVTLNCSAVPSELIESEMFGHEKGAFTGANVARPGKFEHADGGTIFLDEIGDMPLPMQAKLLRVLQEGQFCRVGGNRTIYSSARVLAATNKNLHQEIRAGRFREDLFHRLAVIPITTPPLRARGQDIVLLARAHLGAQHKDFILSEEAARELLRYEYPGNVRELMNIVERSVFLVDEAREITAAIVRAAVLMGSENEHDASGLLGSSTYSDLEPESTEDDPKSAEDVLDEVEAPEGVLETKAPEVVLSPVISISEGSKVQHQDGRSGEVTELATDLALVSTLAGDDVWSLSEVTLMEAV